MTLIAHSYGKSRVRVMRVLREAERESVRELSLDVTLQGAFDRSYTHADNALVVATDTIKNICNIVAREHLAAANEAFCAALADRFLDRYRQVERVIVDASETRWRRASIGFPHPHAFELDGNGTPTVRLDRSRDAAETRSGIAGYAILKSTGSGWTGYVLDDVTTLPETRDRIASTSLDASWLWSAVPDDPEAVNAAIVGAMLGVFATTYSAGMQDSLFRMGEAALAAAPAVAEIRLSAPNKHYLPIDLSPFGRSSDNLVFTPTDEPHGLISCVVGR